MMDDATVLSIISRCFMQVERKEWKRLISGSIWTDFLDNVRDLTQVGRRLGDICAPIMRLKPSRPLQEALSECEVEALFVPPSYEEKHSFAARHFTGGLPESALPVESLYVGWHSDMRSDTRNDTHGDMHGDVRDKNPSFQSKGSYLGDTAAYMADTIEAMGGSIPAEFSAYPDHLCLELDLVAVLLRRSMVAEARQFVVDRFGWLTAYRMKLLSLKDDASFYIALIDVLIIIRAQLTDESD